jgi:hypothetical protein
MMMVRLAHFSLFRSVDSRCLVAILTDFPKQYLD